MSTNPADLNQQIRDAEAKLKSTQRTRSESRSRTSPTSGVDAARQPEPIPEGSIAVHSRGSSGSSGITPRTGAGASSSSQSGARPVVEDPDDGDDSDDAPGPAPGPSQDRTQTTQGGRIQTPTQVPQRQQGTQRASRPTANGNQGPQVPTDLSEEQKRLMNELIEINGQDSYDALAAGIGKLKKSEYLAIPNNFTPANVPANEVGRPSAHAHMSVQDWANIYVLNKARAPDGVDAKVFALLRLEAVKCGWLVDQREVDIVPPPRDAIRTLATDMVDLRDRASTIKTASFLIPLVAEHTFRTYGHHFISTDAANYTARYLATFRSCLVPEIATILPPAALYHSALHWVSPARARQVLLAQLELATLPDAIKIRHNAAPAGTAILTTTAAILESMSTVGLDRLFAQYGGFDIDAIHTMTAAVKQNPCKYHKSYFAYNLAAPSASELANLERAKDIGVRFAPFAQAYINTYMRDAALGRAAALAKHADQNPIQMRRAQNLFRALGRGDVTTVAQLFTNEIARANDELMG